MMGLLPRIESLFAALQQPLRLRQVRRWRLGNVAQQFHRAATAQKLKRRVRFLAPPQPVSKLRTT